MKKIFLILIGSLILITGCQSNKTTELSYVQFNEIKQNEENYIIVDVRSKSEYQSGHIENSINIPVESISDINNIIEDKTEKIILYCQSGSRSSKAAKELIQYGYTNVYNLTNGIYNSNIVLIK